MLRPIAAIIRATIYIHLWKINPPRVAKDWPQHVGININIFLLFRILTNNMHKLKYNKTDHKTLFILGNSYMFRHQDAIHVEFIKKI